MTRGRALSIAAGLGATLLVLDQVRRHPDDRGVVGPFTRRLRPKGGDGTWQADLFRRDDGSRYLDLEAPDGRYLTVNLTPSPMRRSRLEAR